MAQRRKTSHKASAPARKKRAVRRAPSIDLGSTREVLEQIDLAQRLMRATRMGPRVQSRLAATIEGLSEFLPAREGAPTAEAAALGAALAKDLSGPAWVARFPGSNKPADCVAAFNSALEGFLKALSDAVASVQISSTLRSPERAYLMHWSWKIANDIVAPQDVPVMEGVAIEWVHRDAAGQPDLPKSRSAAKQMVTGYEIVAQPALESRHTQGRAVDMTINWSGTLSIKDVDGTARKINTTPRTGMNTDLHRCGATYGVVKAAFANDPPHWSDDGH